MGRGALKTICCPRSIKPTRRISLFNMKITGLEELQRKLQKYADAAQKLDGKHEATLEQLFHPQGFSVFEYTQSGE
jgi:hypothetical protein